VDFAAVGVDADGRAGSIWPDEQDCVNAGSALLFGRPHTMLLVRPNRPAG